VGLDLVEVLGQLRDQGGVRRIGGLVARVRRGALVVRGVVVGRVAARLGLGVRLVRDGVLVVGFGRGVVRLGLRRLRGGRGGVAGLGGVVVPGTAGRLGFGGRVRAVGGVIARLAGLPGFRVCGRAGAVGRGAGEGPGVGVGPGGLDPGGGAGLLHLEQCGAGGGLARPGGVGDGGDGAAGVGRQRGGHGRCRAVGGGCGI
jgi:hypothetical protein